VPHRHAPPSPNRLSEAPDAIGSHHRRCLHGAAYRHDTARLPAIGRFSSWDKLRSAHGGDRALGPDARRPVTGTRLGVPSSAYAGSA
jgi:hypothetical protein